MNKKERGDLNIAKNHLREAYNIISSVLDDENDSLMNMEDHFYNTERYAAIEDGIDDLDESLNNIEEAIDLVIRAKE